MGKHWTDRGYNAIQFIGVSNCWVDDVSWLEQLAAPASQRYELHVIRRVQPLFWLICCC